MSQTLYVMQGPSGAGKSTIANAIRATVPMWPGKSGCMICSTDDLFYEDGVYNFRPEKLPEFHAMNLANAKQFMDEGYSVIVDNTNIQRWQCREYVKYAVAKGIPVVFVRVNGRFSNLHGVPDEKVEQMRAGMEDLTVESVLASKAPWEK